MLPPLSLGTRAAASRRSSCGRQALPLSHACVSHSWKELLVSGSGVTLTLQPLRKIRMTGGEVTQTPPPAAPSPRPGLPEKPMCAHSSSFLPSTNIHEAERRRGGTPGIFPGCGVPSAFLLPIYQWGHGWAFPHLSLRDGAEAPGTDASEGTAMLSRLPGCRGDRALSS